MAFLNKIFILLPASKFSFYVIISFYTLAKVLFCFLLFNNESHIDSLNFGFGGYVKSLLTDLKFQSVISENLIFYGSRMPGLPFFISLIGLISNKQIYVSILKNIIQSGLLIFFGNRLVLINGTRYIKVLNLVIILFLIFINLIKHTSEINYEEGFIIEYLFILMLFINSRNISKENLNVYFNSILMLSFFIFIFKSSMILIFCFCFIFILLKSLKNGILKFFDIKNSLLVIIILSSLSLWLNHNYDNRNKFTIMTSWEGENLYKGSNSVSYNIYPHISLDEIFNRKLIDSFFVNKDFKYETLPSPSSFSNEQEWSDYYKEKAKNWISENPDLYFLFFIKKVKNYFFSFKISPQSKFDDSHDQNLGYIYKLHFFVHICLVSIW